MRKNLVLIGIALIANKAGASPRTEFLQYKLKDVKTVEHQAKLKADAERSHYLSAKSYRVALEKELENVRKREAREYEQALKYYEASGLEVEVLNYDDMGAETKAVVR